MKRALVLLDGKYTIVDHGDGRVEALRYDEPWRDLTGDHLIAALLDLAYQDHDARTARGRDLDAIAGNRLIRGGRPDDALRRHLQHLGVTHAEPSS